MKLLERVLVVCLLITVANGCVAPSNERGSAHINTQNSLEIALSPFYLVDHSAIDTDHAWHMTLVVSSGKPIAGFLKPNQMLMESFTRWIYSMKATPGQLLTIGDKSVVTADCQGSFTGQIQMSQDGRFSGKLIYADYADDCSQVLDGEVPFEGKFDKTSGVMSAELALPPLVARLDEKELQLQGELDLEFNAFEGEKQAPTGSAEMVLSDAKGIIFNLKKMDFAWDNREEYQKVYANGRIDFPNIGSVKLTTEAPLRISNTPGRLITAYKKSGAPAHTSHKRKLPFDGIFLFHGADGDWVRLFFSKPVVPGFFWVDGSDGLQSKGTL